MTFFNGRKEYQSDWYGSHAEYKTVELDGCIHRVTACYFQDMTCFLMLNRDESMAFGAQDTEVAAESTDIEYVIRDT